MGKAESEFTVSAYFDPDMTTPQPPPARPARTDEVKGLTRELHGTALFDMSAPLVHSGSSHAATPVNTPVLRHETIQRKSRVEKAASRPRKSDGGDLSRNNSSDSIDSLPTPGRQQGPNAENAGMYRLDSHVVAAIQAFAQTGPASTPHLDLALSASLSSSGMESLPENQEYDAYHEDGGLGLGMHLGSVYSQPVTSPLMSDSQRSIRMRSISSQSIAAQKGKGKEVISVTDLDTGLRREMTVSRLNERLRI